MNNGIRLAEERDIPELCEIWKVCFCDNEDYVRFFYRENRGHVTTTVYTVDDRPVSMLHWFDVTFVNGSERRMAKYLYAGGSLPEHRKNGYYGTLIRYVEDYAKENGLILFGKPAMQSLIPYYGTFDFVPDACFRLVTVSPEKQVPVNVYPLSPEEYNKMTNRERYNASSFEMKSCFPRPPARRMAGPVREILRRRKRVSRRKDYSYRA